MYPVTWLILFGVIGAVIAFGVVTNLLGAAFGPWKTLASEFPEQPRQGDSDRGEATLTLTKKHVAAYAEKSQRARPWLTILMWVFWLAFALWLVLAFTGMLGGGLASGLSMVLWVSSFGFYTLLLSWWAWRILRAPAWPQQIDYVADDDHLHLRRISDVIARYPWISVPWGEIGAFEQFGELVVFAIGSKWAATDPGVIQRELEVRASMNAQASAASEPRDWTPA